MKKAKGWDSIKIIIDLFKIFYIKNNSWWLLSKNKQKNKKPTNQKTPDRTLLVFVFWLVFGTWVNTSHKMDDFKQVWYDTNRI